MFWQSKRGFWNFLLKNSEGKRGFSNWSLSGVFLLLFPYSLVLGSLYFRLTLNLPAYGFWTGEDGVIEFLQFLLLLALSFLSLVLLHRYRHQSWKKNLFFGVLAGVYFFLAMEEISWGQRIFDFQAEDFDNSFLQSLFEDNKQNEVTLHNHRIFHHLLDTAFLFISGFLFFGSWLIYRFKKIFLAEYLRFFWVKPKFSQFFLVAFLLMLVYIPIRYFSLSLSGGMLERAMMDKRETEIAEFLVIFGVFLNTLAIFREAKDR